MLRWFGCEGSCERNVSVNPRGCWHLSDGTGLGFGVVSYEPLRPQLQRPTNHLGCVCSCAFIGRGAEAFAFILFSRNFLAWYGLERKCKKARCSIRWCMLMRRFLEEKNVYYCYVSSRHQLGAACQTKRPISLVPWLGSAWLSLRQFQYVPMFAAKAKQLRSWSWSQRVMRHMQRPMSKCWFLVLQIFNKNKQTKELLVVFWSGSFWSGQRVFVLTFTCEVLSRLMLAAAKEWHQGDSPLHVNIYSLRSTDLVSNAGIQVLAANSKQSGLERFRQFREKSAGLWTRRLVVTETKMVKPSSRTCMISVHIIHHHCLVIFEGFMTVYEFSFIR